MIKTRKVLILTLLLVTTLILSTLTNFAEEVDGTTATVTVTTDREFIYTVDSNGSILQIEIITADEYIVLTGDEIGEMNITDTINNIVTNKPEDVEIIANVYSTDEALLTQFANQLAVLLDTTVESLLDYSSDEDTEDEAIGDETTEDEIAGEDIGNEGILNRFELANLYQITPGKMNLLQKLSTASGETIDYADWADAPIQDIMKAIKDYRKGIQEEVSEGELEESDGIDTSDEIPVIQSPNNGNGNNNVNGNGNGHNNGNGHSSNNGNGHGNGKNK